MKFSCLTQKKQQSLDKTSVHKKRFQEIAWEKISQRAYEVGIPFNAVNTLSFKSMIHAIGDYGKAMPYPTYEDLRTPLMNKQMVKTKQFVESFRPFWKQYGCSIMSDFWTDNKERSLINFLVSCPKGTSLSEIY